MHFNEEFLHYIWQFRLLTKREIFCTSGEELRIIDQGTLNKNAGPDFSFAKLKIGRTTWLGNVEIHVRSSDWLLHHHQQDKAYDTVILHAVYIDDFAIYRTDKTFIPTLVLKDLLPELQVQNYNQLLRSRNFFPCARQMKGVDPSIVEQMLEKALHERLEEKSAVIQERSIQNCNHWNETFYYLMVRSFGFKVNEVPFEMLANSLPSYILIKHRDNALQIEALLFGQAGFLEADFKDVYPQQLKSEYGFLRKKYNLCPIDCSLWKFLRIRPNNFPTVRIAQLAALLLYKHHFISMVLEEQDLKKIRTLLMPVAMNSYWKTHFKFDRPVKEMDPQFGHQSRDNLMINTVCLALYGFGKSMGQPRLQEQAIRLLKQIPAERNAIVDQYVGHGMCIKNAGDSQSVLHLNKSYCNQKKCLNCSIGIKILTQ